MKKTLLFAALAALILASCGGNTNQNNNNGAADTTGRDGVQTVSTDADTDAKDTISQKIWEAVKAFDKKLKDRVDEVYNTSWFENPTEKAISKTTYEFTWIYHSEESGDEQKFGAKLGCFPMPDKSWVAVMVPANIYEHNDIRAYNYSDGKVTNADINKLFPEGFELIAGVDQPDLDNYQFNAATMSVVLSAQWPAKYEWKGSEFSPVQPFYEPYTVDMSDGSLNRIGKNPIRINSNSDNIEQEVVKSGVVKNASGKTLAKLDIKGNHIVGYSIVDPNVAVSQEDNLEQGSQMINYFMRPLGYPVTLGMPIKDVLNYKKGNKMKDKTITEGNKDGKYVITQQLCHEDFAGDTYIEFSADSKDAKISGIRVYYEPLTFDYNRDILNSDKLNPQSKAALKAVNLDVKQFGKITGGKVDTTGFTLDLDDNLFMVKYRTYRDKNGCLVALAKYKKKEGRGDYVPDDVKYWRYDNDYLKEFKPVFPAMFNEVRGWAIEGDGEMYLDPDGIYFYLTEDERLFVWNGEEFEEGSRNYNDYYGEEGEE